jgi:hypothetical protein
MTTLPSHSLEPAITKLQDAITGALGDIASELVLLNNHLERIELALRGLPKGRDPA